MGTYEQVWNQPNEWQCSKAFLKQSSYVFVILKRIFKT
jgi:hypothetical protein